LSGNHSKVLTANLGFAIMKRLKLDAQRDKSLFDFRFCEAKA